MKDADGGADYTGAAFNNFGKSKDKNNRARESKVCKSDIFVNFINQKYICVFFNYFLISYGQNIILLVFSTIVIGVFVINQKSANITSWSFIGVNQTSVNIG